jgi:N-acetylglutamate synthase
VVAWTHDRAGAEGACLRVVASNAPAIAIYRSLGRTKERYRDHYRPQADEAWIKEMVEIRGD